MESTSPLPQRAPRGAAAPPKGGTVANTPAPTSTAVPTAESQVEAGTATSAAGLPVMKSIGTEPLVPGAPLQADTGKSTVTSTTKESSRRRRSSKSPSESKTTSTSPAESPEKTASGAVPSLTPGGGSAASSTYSSPEKGAAAGRPHATPIGPRTLAVGGDEEDALEANAVVESKVTDGEDGAKSKQGAEGDNKDRRKNHQDSGKGAGEGAVKKPKGEQSKEGGSSKGGAQKGKTAGQDVAKEKENGKAAGDDVVKEKTNGKEEVASKAARQRDKEKTKGGQIEEGSSSKAATQKGKGSKSTVKQQQDQGAKVGASKQQSKVQASKDGEGVHAKAEAAAAVKDRQVKSGRQTGSAKKTAEKEASSTKQQPKEDGGKKGKVAKEKDANGRRDGNKQGQQGADAEKV
ncbi:unnamed protein product, partial [Chrysoparadoxa australica]